MERLTGAGADAAAEALEDAMRHLESCDDCRFRLLGIEPPVKERSVSARKTPECPAEETWWLLAAEIQPGPESGQLRGHAENCEYCGPLLKAAIQDLTADFTPEEETRVEALESSKPEWQKAVVRKVSDSVVPRSNTTVPDNPAVVS